MLGEYIKGRLRAFVFFFQHPNFKFRDALKGCEEVHIHFPSKDFLIYF